MAGKGIFEAAAHHFQEALRLHPADVEASYNLGVALMKTGNLAQAALAFKAVLRLDPDFTKAHTGLAVVSTQQGRFDSAISAKQQK